MVGTITPEEAASKLDAKLAEVSAESSAINCSSPGQKPGDKIRRSLLRKYEHVLTMLRKNRRTETDMKKKKLVRQFQYEIFFLPALIAFTTFTIIPLLKTIMYSVTDFNGVNHEYRFVGLKNFIGVFQDEVCLLYTSRCV